MKALFAILLSLLILVQPLSKILLVVEYQVNKNYIAAVLCVNKARPQLHCNGKCQLSKELKAAEKHDKKLPVSVKEFQEVVYFYQPILNQFTVPFSVQPKPQFGRFLAGASIAPAFAFFHPPC